MLISVLLAPYTWFMDQAVLIPAILHGAYLNRSRILFSVLALASAVVEFSIFKDHLPVALSLLPLDGAFLASLVSAGHAGHASEETSQALRRAIPGAKKKTHFPDIRQHAEERLR